MFEEFTNYISNRKTRRDFKVFTRFYEYETTSNSFKKRYVKHSITFKDTAYNFSIKTFAKISGFKFKKCFT